MSTDRNCLTRLLLCSRRTKRKKRVTMKINTSRKAGFTLVEIMIVVAIIGLLAAIAIPNFVKARETSRLNACVNNLRQFDGAIQQWALETKASANAAVTSGNILPYIKQKTGGGLPSCPSSGTYTISRVDTVPTCSVATHVLP